MPSPPDLPPFFKKHQPHSCRRAKFHNYKAPGIYMITISKHPEAPTFSLISGDLFDPQNSPTTTLTNVGQIIDLQIKDIEEWKFFEIREYVIMPDHIHIIWQVKEWLTEDLGRYVGYFKSRCALNFRNYLKEKGYQTPLNLFCEKFNDIRSHLTPKWPEDLATMLPIIPAGYWPESNVHTSFSE